MKTVIEILMVLGSLLFWALALPLAGLWELGVVVADRVDGHHPHGLAPQLAHFAYLGHFLSPCSKASPP